MLISREICDGYTDQELMQKATADVEYFSCLYERYEAQLLRYIKRLLPVCEDEAEDILQEAFIKLWKNLHAFDHTLKFSSWLYRIVHNHAVSCIRKRKSFGKDRRVEWNEEVLSDITDPSDEGLAEGLNERDLQIGQYLDQLPLPYKEVLVLKFLEGMSYVEISDVLKIPEGTVAARINRAKKAFREIAGDQFFTLDL